MLLVHELAFFLTPGPCFHLSPVSYDTSASPQLAAATENTPSKLQTPMGVCLFGRELSRANLGSSFSSVWLNLEENPSTWEALSKYLLTK